MSEALDLETLFGRGKGAYHDDVGAAARAVLLMRARKDEAERRLEDAGRALTEAESTLRNKLEAAGLVSVKVDGDGGLPVSLSMANKTYYALPAGSLDEKDIHLWLLRSGGHDLVKRTIHHASFSSFCRELAEQGKPLHPAVKITEIKSISVRKG